MIGGGLSCSPRLQIYGLNDDANGWMGLGSEISNYAGRLSIGNYDGNQYQSRLTILASGNFGIGRTNPLDFLDVRIFSESQASIATGELFQM